MRPGWWEGISARGFGKTYAAEQWIIEEREAQRRMAQEKQRKIALKERLIRAAVASPEKRRVLLSEWANPVLEVLRG